MKTNFKFLLKIMTVGIFLSQSYLAVAEATLPPSGLVKIVVNNYLDGWNEHSMTKIASLYVDDVALYDLPTNSYLKGKAEVVKLEEEIWLKSSPDMVWAKTGKMHISGDTAIYEWIWTGTYNGMWGDIEVKDKKFSLPGLSMTKVNADGFIYEQRDYYDMYSFQQQLGVLK